jgi:hypothetical protein
MSVNSTNEYVLPSNPKDLEAIKNGIEEIKVQLTYINLAKEQIKAITDRLKDELEVPPKIAKKMAVTSLKDDEEGNAYEQQSIEHQSFEIAYEKLYRDSGSDVSDQVTD